MIDRLMARCERASCGRWITITAPTDEATCPSCAIDGVVSRLEIIDMQAHIAALPAATDAKNGDPSK